MPDITLCTSKECKQKEMCERHENKHIPDIIQAYKDFSEDKYESGECDYFILDD